MLFIVITGGPGAGKSTLINAAYDCLRELKKDHKVFCLTETATELISGAHISPTENITEFQRVTFELQLQKEDRIKAYIDSIGSDGDKTVILFDRGAFDAKAYIDAADWDMILRTNRLSEADLIKRYSYVFILETAAKAGAKLYSTDNNPARHETPQEAVAVDDRIIAAWSGFPRDKTICIPASEDFEAKKSAFIEVLMSIIDDSTETE